jgi:hypothetical protein
MTRSQTSRPSIPHAIVMVALSCITISASGAEQTRYGNVISKFVANDCNGAVVELNAGLAADQADIVYLAAAMFEQGNCLRQDWEKAAQLYQRAYTLGNERAVPKLVALFALKNHDPAAALAWAALRPLGLPAACVPSAAGLLDPSVLGAELSAWPADRLKACVYTAGVIYKIFSELGFSGSEWPDSKKLKFEVTFLPAADSIEWRTPDGEVTYSGAAKNNQKSNKPVFLEHAFNSVSRLGDKVLATYGPISNIDQTWKVTTRVDLNIKYLDPPSGLKFPIYIDK